jgi:curli biogenesis system outer membrane secretion channel CsgG
MEGIHTISVPTFKNATLIPRIEVLVADTIIRQIQQDGTYRIASSDADADALLEGEITEVRRKPSRTVIGDVQATQEFTMTLTIHTRIIRKATGEVVDERNINGQTSFFVSGDVNQDERQAIPIAAQDAAVRLVSEISEGW